MRVKLFSLKQKWVIEMFFRLKKIRGKETAENICTSFLFSFHWIFLQKDVKNINFSKQLQTRSNMSKVICVYKLTRRWSWVPHVLYFKIAFYVNNNLKLFCSSNFLLVSGWLVNGRYSSLVFSLLVVSDSWSTERWLKS